MKEILIRVLIGGTVVSAFALLADLLRPKSFAGIFGTDAMHNNQFSTALMFIRHIFISAFALSFYKVPLWGANCAGSQAL
jgi:hypothetical protein